jgi:hypothetical protein
MHFRHVPLVLCLLSVSALSQSPTKTPTSLQTPIHGIKIFSSSFDATTQTVKLDFMNDSPTDITAWGYCVKTVKAKSDDPDQSFCTWVDTLPVVVDREVHERTTLKPSRGACGDCYFIHSGEHKTISALFSSDPVASADIEINLIIQADASVESNGKEGTSALQEISRNRQVGLRLAKMLVSVGQGILDDQTNRHPTASMMIQFQKLLNTEPALKGSFYFFKRPEWRKANNAEFIPEDERGYLRQFVTENQLKIVEFSKHQLPGVN